MHANDNVKTPHLKCDRCRTRTSLKRIEAKPDGEYRTFACANCLGLNHVFIRHYVAQGDANEGAS